MAKNRKGRTLGFGRRLLCLAIAFQSFVAARAGMAFPDELIKFTPDSRNPVFTGEGAGHWDERIRERGWILYEDGVFHLWYTGYSGPDNAKKFLGYATSRDGYVWTRYGDGPIYTEHWVEDMTVVHAGDTHYMFAEGQDDQAHLLTSTDRVHWTRQGVLDIRKVNGDPIAPGPFGTPAVLYEDGVWYLLYERNDEAVWLATSRDALHWKHVQDGPVFKPGPDDYDKGMIAVNQIVKYQGMYYIYYHGLMPNTKPQLWTTSIAASDDLVHWEKFAGNPIIKTNNSSAVLVRVGEVNRLYTMHPEVCVFHTANSQTTSK